MVSPTGRVALVTGAARGIGAATVLGLVTAGWSVVAVDRGADDERIPYPMGTLGDLHRTVGAAESIRGDSVISRVADTTDPVSLSHAVLEAEKRFGGLDAVIAVAGVIAGGAPLWEMPEPQLRAVMEVDLLGPIIAARVGVPALLRRPVPREGRFIAVASAAATRGLPGLAAYCAAKAGVAGLIRGLAADLRGTGVTATGVSPGSTDSAMLDESARLYRLANSQAFAHQQPIERLLEPEEVAAAIVWLAGTASGAVTGSILPVDGGLSV